MPICNTLIIKQLFAYIPIIHCLRSADSNLNHIILFKLINLNLIFSIYKNLTFNKREEMVLFVPFYLGVLFFAVFIYLCKFSIKVGSINS